MEPCINYRHKIGKIHLPSATAVKGDGAGRPRKRLHDLWLCRKGSLSMLTWGHFNLHFQAGTDFSC